MRTQATRCTKKQLSYMAHWSDPKNGGHVFKRGDVIQESTCIPPGKSWHWAEFAVSGVLVLACVAWMWWRQ